MADLNLTLGVPSGDQTMPASAGNVRRVRVPEGTRSLIITSESAFYIEEDMNQAKADEAASTTTLRHKYVAGSFSLRPFLAGHGGQVLREARYIYLVGTVNAQPFWATAVPEAS